MNVVTPATEVTKVAASAAGATTGARWPDPISTGAKIAPPWCTCRRTAASSPNVMPGDTCLPTITSRITLNGFHTTTAGNNSTLRILMVTGSGKLTLRGLTITDGNTPGIGHRSRSAHRHRLNRPFPKLRPAPASVRC